MLTSSARSGLIWLRFRNLETFSEGVLDYFCKRRAEGCFSKEQGRTEALLRLRMRDVHIFHNVVLSNENSNFPFSCTLAERILLVISIFRCRSKQTSNTSVFSEENICNSLSFLSHKLTVIHTSSTPPPTVS